MKLAIRGRQFSNVGCARMVFEDRQGNELFHALNVKYVCGFSI